MKKNILMCIFVVLCIVIICFSITYNFYQDYKEKISNDVFITEDLVEDEIEEEELSYRYLTSDEIAEVNTAFELFYQTTDGTYKVSEVLYLLTSYYSSPEEIDLHNLVEYFDDGLDSFNYDDILSSSYCEGIDCSWMVDPDYPGIGITGSISGVAIDEYLLKYMNITREDLLSQEVNLIYIEELDTYYTQVTDFGIIAFTCTDGFINDDTLVLNGIIDNYFNTQVQLTFNIVDGNYYIYSFLEVE